jgi:alkylhydroperoxidase family enzyme
LRKILAEPRQPRGAERPFAAELGCEYSLAAVSGIARRSGVAEAALSAAREAKADDERTSALLAVAVDLVRARGRLPEARVAALKSLGYSDGQIVDLIATIGLNTFRAYFNLVGRPVLDFAPVAAASRPAA